MDSENINVTEEYLFKDHLISNNPIADDMEYGDYVDILEAKIKDQGTKNIGIIGPYGAGKSSLIETYKLRASAQNSESKILTISLANFNSDKIKKVPNDGKGNSVGDIDCELEKSILQQILFKAKNKELPESQIKRIEGNKKIRPFLTSLLLIISILGIVFTLLEFLGKLPKSTGNLFYKLLIPTVILCLLSTFVLIRNKIISKIHFKDFEVYLDSCNNDTTLNLFLDEILYFFKKKEIEIVIIEDLDRFENTNVFSKLRELNFLINNSDNIEQKVTFVYSVKDDLFETDADRAKFFDYIISLMPVLSYTNARNKLKNLLTDHCSDDMLLPDLYIQEISHFVVEMRILKNIVNDYIMYYHLLNLNKFGDENRNIKLFSLMLYKNVNPKDYAKLQYGKGNLANIFNNLRTNVKNKINILKDEIKTKECDIEAAKNTTIKSFEQLKWIVKAVIFANQNYNYEPDALDIEGLTTFEGVNFIKYRVSGRDFCYISIEQLNKKLDFSILQEENNIKNRTEDAIAKINEEIKEIREQIRLFSNCTVKEYLKNDDSITKDCNLLIKMLLANGYIAEDYRDYMSKNGQEIITSSDNEFIKNVIAKQKMEFSIKLDKPECVIQELQPHHFSDIYTFNYDIVMSLLTRTSCEKKENLINLLSSDGKETNEFIISYINDDNDINLILDNLIPSFDNLYNIILASHVNNKFGMIEYLIDNFDIKLITKQNQNSCITKYLSELKLCINKFKSEKLQKLLNVMITCDVCLKDIECIPERYHIAETIVDHSKFEINSGNLKFFLEKIKREESSKVDNALYSTILETKYEKLITYVENSFDKLLDIILSKDAHLENQDAFEKVLSYSTTQVYKDMFIEKSAIKYDLFNAISAECAKKSFEKLKIHPRWSNISIAINSNKVDIKELITYLEEFSMDLGLDELKDTTLFNLICKQKYNKAESLKNLLLSYKGTISFDTNIPEENLVILLEQNKIVLNDANFRAAARKPMVIEQFIYQNSIYAEKLNYIGFDRVVWTYLFESSKLSWAIKSKILNIWRSSYLPTSDQEVVVLSNVLLNWSISETIPSNLIEHCLKNTALAKEVKENIIIKCCRNLDKPTLIRLVNYVDPLYGEMISKSKTQIDKTKINPQIMSLLKDKSILNYNYGSKNYNIK